MNRSQQKKLCITLLTGALCFTPLVLAHLPARGDSTPGPQAAGYLQGDDAIFHALNRLTFGPRPGDVDRVRQVGLRNWIEQQLHPETIPDSDVDARVAQFPALKMSTGQLLAAYNNDRKQNKQKKKAKKDAQNQAGNAPDPQQQKGNGQRGRESVEAVGEMENAKLIRAVDSNRQLEEVLVDFWANHFNEDVKKGPVRTLRIADERDVIRPNVFGKFRDMLEASAKSPAMLFYLDNASSTAPAGAATGRGQGRFQGRGRGNGLRGPGGRRRRNGGGGGNLPIIQPADVTSDSAGLQLADVTSDRRPVQLADNTPAAAPAPAAPKGGKRRGGLNENYAREIMELHTLGVDGGYTQQDVQEVARCFTGWGYNHATGEFQFSPGKHDNGQKVVLGHVIPPGGGIQDGETVLDILASHPSTSRFISRELCQRLVSDTPPPALVDRAAQTFRNTNGDLRQVVEAIILAPEFWSASNYRSKVKSPFEYAVSAIRALDAHLDVPDPSDNFGRRILVADGGVVVNKNGKARLGGNRRFNVTLAQEVADMGQPLYSYEFPTGYSEDSRTWVSSGGLVARFNFALALTGGKVADVNIPSGSLAAGASAAALVKKAEQTVLGGAVSTTTRTVVERQAQQGRTPAELTALLLGSPEFQKK